MSGASPGGSDDLFSNLPDFDPPVEDFADGEIEILDEDPLAIPVAVPQISPLGMTPQVASPVQSAAAVRSSPPSNRATMPRPKGPIVAAMLIGGGLVGLIPASLLAWILLRGESPESPMQSAPLAHAASSVPADTTSSPPEPSPAHSRNAPATNASSSAPPAPPVIRTSPANNAPSSTPNPVPKTADPYAKPQVLKPAFTGGTVKWFELPDRSWTFAYDAETERIFVGQDRQGVFCYRVPDLLQGKYESDVILGGQYLPLAMIIKRYKQQRFLIFSRNNDLNLVVRDLDTFEIGVPLRVLNGDLISLLATSDDPDDPFVYFKCEQYGQRRTPCIGRFNLTDRGEPQPQIVPDIDTKSLAISPDGKLVYLGGMAHEWSELLEHPELRIDPSTSVHVFDPDSSLVGFNNRVMDSNDSLRNHFNAEVLCFLKRLPIALSFDASKNTLNFLSKNSFTQHLEFKAPAPGPLTEDTFDQFRLHIFNGIRRAYANAAEDPAHGHVIALLGRHLAVARTDELSLPNNRFIPLQPDLPKYVTLGVSNQVPFSGGEGITYAIHDIKMIDRDGSLDAVNFSDKKHEPMIDGKGLTWFPDSSSAGNYRLIIRASANDDYRDIPWETTVGYPSIDLDFYPWGVAIDPVQPRAFVWGWDGDSIRSPAKPPYRLALLDLESQKVLQTTKCNGWPRGATMDGRAIIAWEHPDDAGVPLGRRSPTSTRIIEYDPETLQARREVMVPQRISEMRTIDGRYLFGITDVDQPMIRMVYPDLAALPTDFIYRDLASAGRLCNQWMWDGVLWNADWSHADLLLYPWQFAERVGSQERQEWNDGFLMRNSRGNVACWRSGGPEMRPMSGEQLISNLHLNDDSPPNRDPYNFAENSERFVLVSSGRLYVFNQPVSSPNTFSPRQSSILLHESNPQTVTYECHNAPGKYTLELCARFKQKTSSLTFHSATGEFQVQLNQAFLAELAPVLTDILGKPEWIDNHRVQAAQKAIDYIDARKEAFNQLTGSDPTGIPVPIWAKVTAEYADGQSSVLGHAFLVDLSPKMAGDIVMGQPAPH